MTTRIVTFSQDEYTAATRAIQENLDMYVDLEDDYPHIGRLYGTLKSLERAKEACDYKALVKG